MVLRKTSSLYTKNEMSVLIKKLLVAGFALINLIQICEGKDTPTLSDEVFWNQQIENLNSDDADIRWPAERLFKSLGYKAVKFIPQLAEVATRPSGRNDAAVSVLEGVPGDELTRVATPLFERALSETNDKKKIGALIALRDLKLCSEACIAKLIDLAVDEKSPKVQEYIGAAIATNSKARNFEVLPLFQEKLKRDAPDKVRTAISHILYEMSEWSALTPDMANFLLVLAKDKNSQVQNFALRAIGRFPNANAAMTDLLVTVSFDQGNPENRAEALTALYRRGRAYPR